MRFLQILSSRTVLIPLAMLFGAVAGAGGIGVYFRHWSSDRWSMEAYEAANNAALLDQNKPDVARDQLRGQMAVALDSFAASATESEIKRNTGLLKSISTYLAATPGLKLSLSTQQLLGRFPPYTPEEAVRVKCTAALCEISKRKK